EESDVNLKDSNDEKDGWFDSVKSCFRNNCSKDNIEEMGSETEIPTDQEDGLEGLGENSERNEKVADGADCFEIPVHSNFMTRAEPFTSDCASLDAIRNEGNGKLFDSEVEEARLEWPQINK
ncbi:hypothetical protein LINPERPRIM_LOCUS20975, partial [Linum perenne]